MPSRSPASTSSSPNKRQTDEPDTPGIPTAMAREIESPMEPVTAPVNDLI